MPYKDPANQRACARRFADANPDVNREASRRYRERNREKTRSGMRRQHKKRRVLFDEYLNDHPCATCGCPDRDVLVFHHINPGSKEFKVAGSLHSWTRVLAEIGKCVVLCSNCHMRVHRLMDRISKGEP